MMPLRYLCFLITPTKLTFGMVTLICLLILSACQNMHPTQTQTRATLQVQIKLPEKILKQTSDFKTQMIDPSEIYYGKATLMGQEMAHPIAPTFPTHPIPLSNGQTTIILTFDNVPPGHNRVVTIQGLNQQQDPLAASYTIKGVVDIAAGNNSLLISPQTTPTAEIVEQLSLFIDKHSLQNLVDRLVNNDTPNNPLDDIHPSLIDVQAIVNTVFTSGLVPEPDRSKYVLTPGTISGTISGLQESYLFGTETQTVFPSINLSLNDSASPTLFLKTHVVPGNANRLSYTINGITPGQNYTLWVQPDYHYGQELSVSVAPGEQKKLDIHFGSESKRHWFQQAIATFDNKVVRYRADTPVDILLVKPLDLEQNHLDAVKFAIAQIKSLYASVLTIGEVHEVFENDPDFNQIELPPMGSFLSADPADPNSPNYPANLNQHLIGKYDLYIRWRSDFGCPTSKVGITRASAVSANTYTTIIELATHTCSQVLPEHLIRGVAAHELTHALGGMSHSPHSTDLMFTTIDSKQPVNINPSIQDINTLRFLFQARSSITNTDRSPL